MGHLERLLTGTILPRCLCPGEATTPRPSGRKGMGAPLKSRASPVRRHRWKAANTTDAKASSPAARAHLQAQHTRAAA
eukprot:8510773-Pyramimonas_sp.AAC.1